MRETKEKALLLRNLKDAGCDGPLIKKYLQLQTEEKQQAQLKLLYLHRASLLDQVHSGQRMIDCLDYLIFTLKK